MEMNMELFIWGWEDGVRGMPMQSLARDYREGYVAGCRDVADGVAAARTPGHIDNNIDTE
jgi:hypothetical protein